MKYIILIIVLITIIFSCNNQKQNIDQQFIDTILNEEVDSQIIIFLKSEDKENVGYTTVSILQKTSEADNRFNTHDKQKFIADALSGKIEFGCDDIIRCVIINDTIKNFYIENSFSAFFNTYCTLDSKDEYIIKNNLSFNAELSVIYFLYQNQFYTTQD